MINLCKKHVSYQFKTNLSESGAECSAIMWKGKSGHPCPALLLPIDIP